MPYKEAVRISKRFARKLDLYSMQGAVTDRLCLALMHSPSTGYITVVAQN